MEGCSGTFYLFENVGGFGVRQTDGLPTESLYSRRKTAARLVQRASIVLLAAEGKQDLQIAHLLSVVPRTAACWRARFLREGTARLEHDASRWSLFVRQNYRGSNSHGPGPPLQRTRSTKR